MNFDEMMQNLKNAFDKLLAMRFLVSSPTEKIADLPLLLIIITVIAAPRASLLIAIVGLIARCSVRIEKDYVMRR